MPQRPTYDTMMRIMADKYGYRNVHSCHIAHVLSDYGKTRRIAPNRKSLTSRRWPCPARLRGPIETMLRDLYIIPAVDKSVK